MARRTIAAGRDRMGASGRVLLTTLETHRTPRTPAHRLRLPPSPPAPPSAAVARRPPAALRRPPPLSAVRPYRAALRPLAARPSAMPCADWETAGTAGPTPPWPAPHTEPRHMVMVRNVRRCWWRLRNATAAVVNKWASIIDSASCGTPLDHSLCRAFQPCLQTRGHPRVLAPAS